METIISSVGSLKDSFLGLSLWVQILIGIVALIPAYLVYLGAFKKITFKKEEFKPKIFLYKDIQSKMTDLGNHFTEIQKNMDRVFKQSKSAAIYHDDPQMVKDEKNTRVSVGFLVDESEEKLVEKFTSIFPEYKNHTLGFTGYKNNFPFRNMLSYFLGPMKVYYAFEKYMEKNGLKLTDVSCPLEYYHCDRIEFYFPLSENGKSVTSITTIPFPEYKEKYRKEQEEFKKCM